MARIHAHCITASLGTIMLLANSAYAADEDIATKPPGGVSYEINGSQNFSYDSNPLRLPSGEKSLTGSTTSPELVIRSVTPTTTVESTSRVDASFYNHSEFNSVDLHENLFLSKSNQRWTADLRTLYDRDTTRTGEITSYGLNLPRVYRTQVEARPQIIFRSSERDLWRLATSASNTHYDNNNYTDYNYYSVSPSFEHKFDMKNTGTIGVSAQRYETASGTDSSSDSYGPNIGWRYQSSDRLTLHANAGAMSTQKHGANSNLDESSWDYVFAAGANYKGTLDDVDFTVSRARAPFGNGTETLLDSVLFNERHAINKKLDATAKAQYRMADYPSGQPGTNLDHEYTVGGGLAYKVVDNVALTADYSYHQENLTNNTGNIDEQIVMVGVTLNPSWSRK